MVNGKRLVVYGFPRCGSSSLLVWLKKRGHNALKLEICWKPKPKTPRYKGYTPVFITRNPVDRIWSHYHYFRINKHMPLEQFLASTEPPKGLRWSLGKWNPVAQSNYARWIEPWYSEPLFLFRFEEVIQAPDFPAEREMAYTTPPLDDESRGIIVTACRGMPYPTQ